MKRIHQQKLIFWAAYTALAGVLFFFAIRLDFFESLHLRFSNFLYWKTESRVSDRIVIVAIDNKSFARKNASELQTLKFNKADYAKVIDNLENAGAAAIGMDIIFSETSDAKDMAFLTKALKKYDNVILAAEPKTATSAGLLPLKEFIDARPDNLASILFTPDRDDVVRRERLSFDDPHAPIAFSVRIIQRLLNLLPEDSKPTPNGFQIMPFTARVGTAKVPPITVPTDGKDNFLVNFFGPANSFDSVSFVDAVDNKFIERKSGKTLDLKGKIILIGEMGTGIHDEQYTPVSYGVAMPGVEIHANAIQTLLSQRFLRNQSATSETFVAVVILAAALALFLVLNIIFSIGLLLACLLVYTVTTWVWFEYGLILNMVYPYLGLLLAFIGAYIFRYFAEARAARKTEAAFSRYVSSNVVQKILDNPDTLALGGEKKELTVFFSDIEGFTTISEALAPEALVEQLNEYLDHMNNVIFATDGTVDKFIGDAVMAFWGAPLPQPDHAVRGCLAALAYQAELSALREKWMKAKKMPFKARIGINTGDMIVGNIGSSRRFDYTVIGDSVNFASRLEGLNKFYGTYILISESTYQQAKDFIEAREIDLVTVKGKTKPVRVYELLSKKGALPKPRQELVRQFAEALTLYRAQKWDEASKAFGRALELDILDGPCKTYLERCAELKDSNMPKDWDGAYVFHSK